MDALIIFACVFTPTFIGAYLMAGRDELLFEHRPRGRRWVTLVSMAVALAVLVALGLSPAWAVALVVAGPLGTFLGSWLGSGEWIVTQARLRRLLRRGQ